MWIVRLALSQPHTFIVLAILIALFGVVSIRNMAIDIFPSIDVPVVSCVWTYTGMSPDNIENLITSPTERAFASTVGGIERIESMSLNGMSIIKVYLHKGADIGQAVAQVSSTGNAVMKQLPQNITPPFVTQSSATDVPVLQLVVSGQKLDEAKLFDLASNFIRVQLSTVQGSTILFPNGGKYRQVCVDLDPRALVGYGLSPTDVMDVINDQSIIVPSGTAKLGRSEYWVTLNNIPDAIDKFNNIPIKHVGGATVYVKDVGFVHDGYQPQLNIVNLNGHRSVIMNILKNGTASTLDVVDKIKAMLPKIRDTLPPSATLDILTDQSKFVRDSVDEVFQEVVTAAGLTALFMLAILGSWRSTLIVISSIPLAMLCSVIGLYVTGNTINSMTLGGLALAVGMLVDDATVEIENVHRQLDLGKHVEQAILDGAQEVALPAFVSTISICIVFLPVFLLIEPARSLFIPLGLAVSFAMLASYGLSRTIVPLMSKHLFASEEHVAGEEKPKGQVKEPGYFERIYLYIDRHFNALRDQYHKALAWALDHRMPVVAAFLCFYAISLCLLPFVGRDFFPPIDAGQLRLHVNVPAGTRVEETERIYRSIENSIGKIIPKDDIEVLTDNIGLPVSGVNFAFTDSQTIGEADGEILITLKEDRAGSTAEYQKRIRAMLTKDYPECSYYFQPADIITQIINAGLPAPINIKVIGMDQKENLELALKIKRAVDKIPGAVDVCLHQVVNSPAYLFEVDRTRADQMGLTQSNISDATLITLSSSFQVSPNFWVNPKNGVQYYLETLSPQYRIGSLIDIGNIPISSATTHIQAASSQQSQAQISPTGEQSTQLLCNVAQPIRKYIPYVVNHYNVQPTYDIYAACQTRDLGSVSDDINNILKDVCKKLPRGTTVVTLGQVLAMNGAFAGLLIGLAGALLLIYLLLVVNFQSWTDPVIILMAIPGALCGIIWSLFVTQTTLSVPALMGTIMTIGVASANSILVVTFCNENLRENHDVVKSALTAGFQRFRPVCMTACAMILGMIPMSMSAGINAPIGRAVIGGLSVATLSTLFFVPIMFSIIRHGKTKPKEIEKE
ncbi:MAG: efflux RND transporter permease subunit [Candidatus Obscuribacterales bacterium]|nr:efflux RND transporter permease subunit [Candidatus Obscuribacterales bacterium]